MSLALRAEGLAMSYAGRAVLKGITHSFGPGITAVMGPNGSGKSTLLRLLALLEEPAGGEVVYRSGAARLPHDMALRRRVTLVLPGGGLFNASAVHNAAYGLRVRGVGRQEAEERAMEALRLVGLEGKRRQNALTLSSGEAQRLAIARAVVIKPEALFLDEPTASVDEENTEIIEGIVRGLSEAGDAPLIVLSTHDRGQAERLARETLSLKRGVLSAPGRL